MIGFASLALMKLRKQIKNKMDRMASAHPVFWGCAWLHGASVHPCGCTEDEL
jgi:hypothetical protein